MLCILLCPALTPRFAQVDWANLAAVDLSKATTYEGRKGLVKQVHDAIKDDGFLFVTNHSATPEQVGPRVLCLCI